jgi:hypothetical protein
MFDISVAPGSVQTAHVHVVGGGGGVGSTTHFRIQRRTLWSLFMLIHTLVNKFEVQNMALGVQKKYVFFKGTVACE